MSYFDDNSETLIYGPNHWPQSNSEIIKRLDCERQKRLIKEDEERNHAIAHRVWKYWRLSGRRNIFQMTIPQIMAAIECCKKIRIIHGIKDFWNFLKKN